MSQSVKETLYQVAEEVLEKIAFIFSFPEDERRPLDFNQATVASVSFSGLFDGFLLMAVSQKILPELTGNMLGVDGSEETSFDEQHDALKELINVICGNLLPAVAGKQIIFNVETPKILETWECSAITAQPVSAAKLSIEDDGKCDILLFVNGNIPENIAADSGE